MVDRKIVNAGTLHYLDDFLFISKADSPACLEALTKFKKMEEFFGIPLTIEKTVLLCTRLEFLSIRIDTQLLQFSLPEEKIAKSNPYYKNYYLQKKNDIT